MVAELLFLMLINLLLMAVCLVYGDCLVYLLQPPCISNKFDSVLMAFLKKANF